MVSTFEIHRRTPEVTLDAHTHRSLVALGVEVARRKAVYLDTNFWIWLRDAASGTSSDLAAADLLTLLRDRVARGVLFCPISAATFVELVKQSDSSTRTAMAKLIDELSLGVALIEIGKRIGTEIAYFIWSNSSQTVLHPLKHLVWTKLIFVLGIQQPAADQFNGDDRLVIQKSFFDLMWAKPLSELVASLNDVAPITTSDFDESAHKMNIGIAAHADEIRSFNQAYSAEVRGAVDLFAGTAVDIVAPIVREHGIADPSQSISNRLVEEKAWKRILAFVLEKNRARDVLRTLHIYACLHASLRWNKGHELEGNDLLDFEHATAALAYCNAFFTERSLRTVVTQNHIALDKQYGCNVMTKLSDAVEYVKTLR